MANGTVCKTDVRGFESRPRLYLPWDLRDAGGSLLSSTNGFDSCSGYWPCDCCRKMRTKKVTQSKHRQAPMSLSSNGSGHGPLKAVIAGSNPRRDTGLPWKTRERSSAPPCRLSPSGWMMAAFDLAPVAQRKSTALRRQVSAGSIPAGGTMLTAALIGAGTCAQGQEQSSGQQDHAPVAQRKSVGLRNRMRRFDSYQGYQSFYRVL